METPFYMVYVPDGRGPAKTHETLYEAQKEAMRLFKLEGKAAYVLVTVGCYIPQPPVWALTGPTPLVETDDALGYVLTPE